MTRPASAVVRHARALAALVVALLLTGCAAASHTVVYVPIERGEPTAVAGDPDDASVLRTVASVLVTRFELPLRAPIRAYFYGSKAAFEAGLVKEALLTATVARDQAAYAVGVGTAYGIFLRGDQLRAAPLALRAGVFAHELAHISQYELAGGGRGVSEQWLREGFADWVKYRTVDVLGIRRYGDSRNVMENAVRDAMAKGEFPDLDHLSANRDWMAHRRRAGSMATYGQAFLAVDQLVERVGHPTVVDYFRRAGASKDRDASFQASFNVLRAEFVADFRRYLAALRARAAGAGTASTSGAHIVGDPGLR